jgi:hypothetical protein
MNLPLIRPRESKVRARSGGQPGHSSVVVRGIVLQYSVSLVNKNRDRERGRYRGYKTLNPWFLLCPNILVLVPLYFP